MFFTFILGFCAVFLGIWLWHKPNNKRGKQLPGPTPLPLLGNILQIGFRPYITFSKWAKLYGPIYRLKLGLKDAVIVTDYKLIKNIFNESAIGAPQDNPVILEFSRGPYGLLNSTGSTWEAQRKFTVKTLRNLGFVNASMETMILDEVKTLMNWFRKGEGSPISGKRLFNAPVVNSLWCLVTGERCNWEEGPAAIIDAMDTFFKEIMNVSTNGVFFVPVLRFIAPNIFRWNQYVKSVDKMMELIRESIKNHQETFNSTELRDFIDHYLLEIANETNPKSSFYKDAGNANMIATLFDLFFAGSETSATTLSWALLHLSANQKLLVKLQKEIDEVVGSRLPSLLNRIKMPYSEAVISEALRIGTVSAVGNPKRVKSDFVFSGYHIPKGASVFSNLYGVNHDPEIWGDPECFRPERFLSEDGTRFVRNEALISFSEGKRKCLGETFAKDAMFLFVTSICQQFNILPNPNNKDKIDFEADVGIMLGPKPFKVVMSSRTG